MDTFVVDSLATQVRELLELGEDHEDLEEVMGSLREKAAAAFRAGTKKTKRKGVLKPKPHGWDSDIEGEHWEDQPGAHVYVEDGEDDSPKPATKRGGKKAAGSDDDNESIISATAKKTAPRKAPAKRAPAKPKAPAKTPAKRKKAQEDEEDDDDVMMMDDIPPPVAKSQPRRAAATAVKARQTQLSFSQPAKSQNTIELSDDEISDEDAFEPVASSRKR